MEIAKQQISDVQSEREKIEKVLREKDKKMKEMEERFQQQFEEEIQQIIKKHTATMEGTDKRTIPKTRHRETSLDKEPKTMHFDPEAKKEEGTARRRRRTMSPDMEWDYGYRHLWDGMEEYSNGEEYKKFSSTPRDEGESIPTLEESEVPKEYYCENCQLTHKPPICPCPICERSGHFAVDCSWARELESGSVSLNHRQKTEWKMCQVCHINHQRECPCKICEGIGHSVAECPLIKQQKWRSRSTSRGKRDQISPEWAWREFQSENRHNFKWCGYCRIAHHVEAGCLGPVIDKSLWCAACRMTTMTHLRGCPGIRGCSQLCYLCRMPGHLAKDCKKYSICGDRGHGKDCPKKIKEPRCRKCGNDQHISRYCRVPTRMGKLYEELVKKDPLGSIDQSIYSPEFTQDKLDEQIKKLQEEKQRHYAQQNPLIRGVNANKREYWKEIPRCNAEERPQFEPRTLENRVTLGVPHNQWTPYRDEQESPELVEQSSPKSGTGMSTLGRAATDLEYKTQVTLVEVN